MSEKKTSFEPRDPPDTAFKKFDFEVIGITEEWPVHRRYWPGNPNPVRVERDKNTTFKIKVKEGNRQGWYWIRYAADELKAFPDDGRPLIIAASFNTYRTLVRDETIFPDTISDVMVAQYPGLVVAWGMENWEEIEEQQEVGN